MARKRTTAQANFQFASGMLVGGLIVALVFAFLLVAADKATAAEPAPIVATQSTSDYTPDTPSGPTPTCWSYHFNSDDTVACTPGKPSATRYNCVEKDAICRLPDTGAAVPSEVLVGTAIGAIVVGSVGLSLIALTPSMRKRRRDRRVNAALHWYDEEERDSDQ